MRLPPLASLYWHNLSIPRLPLVKSTCPWCCNQFDLDERYVCQRIFFSNETESLVLCLIDQLLPTSRRRLGKGSGEIFPVFPTKYLFIYVFNFRRCLPWESCLSCFDILTTDQANLPEVTSNWDICKGHQPVSLFR